MRSNDLNPWQRFEVSAIFAFCRVVSIMPHWFKYYVLAEVIYFFAYVCCRYRTKVVDKNLFNSFPELSDNERAKIRRDYYRYLSEVMVSTIALAGGSPSKVLFRDYEDSPISRLKAETVGKSWVALTAHQGLWEYFMFWGQYASQTLLAVYHPLENKVFDEVFRRLRCHKNVETVALKDTIRFCLEHQEGVNGLNYVLGLIADQNPPRRPNSEWFNFLNQKTIFFDGGEKIALKLKLPIYFAYQRRLRRGIYEMDYELIHDGIEEVEPYEITRRYIEKLERVIRENPYLWLWSHRRWKHNPNKWKWQKR